MDDRQEIELAHVRNEAELAASVIEARNALGAAAALADAKLSMAMRAVPANDTSDIQFRMAIQEAVRTGVIADLLNFNP
ncbi:hypothetical protein L6E12_03780 [Actinokineospora sp. PR83]|uniref:hypothetical protein n=1 Tax=Actinokineospora sp. PR83 TaxID=2884908 RepID=UPI001F32C8CB|nr:hypothetical protein [Actinokineospora sp. PR83]MCG8914909.1 hypothetical protein [Actinokineospora sp. PR83]